MRAWAPAFCTLLQLSKGMLWLGMAAAKALAKICVYPFILTLFNSVEWDETLDNNGNIGAS